MSIHVPTMAEMKAKGENPEILFWVGCSGSFDDRAKKITKAVVKILNSCKVSFAVLGTEESCLETLRKEQEMNSLIKCRL